MLQSTVPRPSQDSAEGSARSDRALLAERYAAVRNTSMALTVGLAPEDQVIQTMPDVSPTKWHLAHTTWFLETFLLTPFAPGYEVFDPSFGYLFNSYYEAIGERHPRPARGLLSRPTVGEVGRYRAAVDEAMQAWLGGVDAPRFAAAAPILEIGLHHEQQHQELLLTDIKHVLAQNPVMPAYRAAAPAKRPQLGLDGWWDHEGGLVEIGHAGAGFAFDNESPRHRQYLPPFRLARRLVTAGQYLDFIRDGGYRRPELWLSDGWAAIKERGWAAPLYWIETEGGAYDLLTLNGRRPLDPSEPVVHVSFYEAEAFANWTGFRLPMEAEWEVVAAGRQVAGNFLDAGHYHPTGEGGHLYGDAWVWTRSAYQPYPGYRAAEGALGEYNGKFMSGQMVLRGGSCATPDGHVRATYRNFFPPDARWQFSGIRLAADV
ncbi:ergothioneine biosynthesis protein EgtB [Desertibaculum subflavum]|uniref:ergothioneine biosynthesis protein EgtB n=1 Tax=Desertibaculum subflavum TaxID=2268458 RepID=UPI000E66A592